MVHVLIFRRKQLYVVYNTDADTDQAPWHELIEEFYNEIDRLNALPQPGMAADSPSRKGNKFASFFPIQPISSRAAPKSRFGSNFGDPCMICLEIYKPGTTVVQLHCDHYFHWMCILGNMDVAGKYAYLCPYCRTGTNGEYPFILHERVGINPEVRDVWDQAEVVDAAYAAQNPDITSNQQYWALQNGLLQLSQNWYDTYGEVQPRSVQVEMSHLRVTRWRYNEARRKQLKEQGKGMQLGTKGFDPTVVGDDEVDQTQPEGEWKDENGVLTYVLPVNNEMQIDVN